TDVSPKPTGGSASDIGSQGSCSLSPNGPRAFPVSVGPGRIHQSHCFKDMKNYHPHAWNLVRFFLMIAPLSRMIPSTPGATVAKTSVHTPLTLTPVFFYQATPCSELQ